MEGKLLEAARASIVIECSIRLKERRPGLAVTVLQCFDGGPNDWIRERIGLHWSYSFQHLARTRPPEMYLQLLPADEFRRPEHYGPRLNQDARSDSHHAALCDWTATSRAVSRSPRPIRRR